MSKLSKQDKIDIYNDWKYYHKSSNELGRQYGIGAGNLCYLLRLRDRYGIQILDRPYTDYSVELKKEAIQRALFGQEAKDQISLDLALPSRGMIHNWIRKYKEDGYNVINHQKGKFTHGRQANSRTAETNKRPKTKEIAQAVTELRQELYVTANFVLDVINSKPDLPHLSRSNYYYTLNKKDKDLKNRQLMKQIKTIFEEHKHRYGYRKITGQLHREGFKVNHKRVKRLMLKMRLYAITIRKRIAKYSSYRGNVGKIKANLINRQFKAVIPDRYWYSDITEFHLNSGKLYLSPIMDGCTQEIISYTISRHPVLGQVMDMLDLAYKKHPALNGLIFHTDQGWQYQHPKFQTWLKNRGITQSMSRKGNSLDDSMMESFFGILKREMFYGFEKTFTNLNELERSIRAYIHYYNHNRIKTVLKTIPRLNIEIWF